MSKMEVDRRSTSAWTSKNPVLEMNVLGLDKNTNRVKLGDGVTHWNDLPFIGSFVPGSVVLVVVAADENVARPQQTGVVYWKCPNGVTPVNAIAGDIIFNAAA